MRPPSTPPPFENGYRIFRRTLTDTSAIPWQAAYGILLIRMNAWADAEGQRLNCFIEPTYPTEATFRAARRAAFDRRETARWHSTRTLKEAHNGR